MTKRLPPLQAVPMSPNGTHAPDEADLSALDDLYPDAASQVRHTTVEMVEDSPRRWVPTLQLNTTVTGLIALAMVCAGWFGHAFFTPAPKAVKPAPDWTKVVTPEDEQTYNDVADACIKLQNPRVCLVVTEAAEGKGVQVNRFNFAPKMSELDPNFTGAGTVTGGGVVIERNAPRDPGHASSPVPDTLPKTIGKGPV